MKTDFITTKLINYHNYVTGDNSSDGRPIPISQQLATRIERMVTVINYIFLGMRHNCGVMTGL